MVEIRDNPTMRLLNNPVKILNFTGIKYRQQVLDIGFISGFFIIPAALASEKKLYLFHLLLLYIKGGKSNEIYMHDFYSYTALSANTFCTKRF